MITTKRLILRPWRESDAPDLFRYASDPDIGPPAGWPPHKSVEESRDVIKNILSSPLCFAVCLKKDGVAIGSIELKTKDRTDLTEKEDECELGFCIAKAFWGRGLIPEAAAALLEYAFTTLGMNKVWCAYYDGNTKSKRAQEKCGFHYMRTTHGLDVPALGEKRTGHVNCLTKEQWLQTKEEK